MNITFAEYASQQDQRQETEKTILRHVYTLCEALRQNYILSSIKNHEISLMLLEGNEDDVSSTYHLNEIALLKRSICDHEYIVETGRKYHKIIMVSMGARSVHAFVDKHTGDVYKSASWSSPAKGIRYNLMNDQERLWLFENADWAGSWLYRR